MQCRIFSCKFVLHIVSQNGVLALAFFPSTFSIICSLVRFGKFLKFGCSFVSVDVLSNFDLFPGTGCTQG